MQSEVKRQLQLLKKEVEKSGINPKDGIGEDLFLFVSSLTPIVNVDLLVYNSKGQFLLSFRDDRHCGRGWHIPGGCVRLRETIDERIKAVARTELHLDNIAYEKQPIKIFEIICNEERQIDCQDERSHFITLVYKCYVPDSYQINNMMKENEAGFLRWFDKLPDDLLDIQQCYKEILK